MNSLLRGYNVDVGVVPIVAYSNGVKETRQHEIDFVVNRGNDRSHARHGLRRCERGFVAWPRFCARPREKFGLARKMSQCHCVFGTDLIQYAA